MTSPAMTVQQKRFTSQKEGALKLYRDLLVGSSSFPYFLSYEFATFLLTNLPGLPGLGLRSLIYPWFLGASQGRPAIGRGVTLRHPKSVCLGKGVILDDFSVLDIRGEGRISLGEGVTVGRFSTIAAKNGVVKAEPGVNIGSYCRIATQSQIYIGQSSLIAAYCYIGPGNHKIEDSQTPLIERDMEIKGGVTIGQMVWIGANTTILDGVKIGDRAIVGAHSLVREDVPEGAVVAGSPARILRPKVS
jgi:serine acetyltransferase